MWEVRPGVAPWPAGTSRPALMGLSARSREAKTPKEEGRLKEIMSRESFKSLIGLETCAGMTVAGSGRCKYCTGVEILYSRRQGLGLVQSASSQPFLLSG